jgi:hypothetical protein
MGFVLDMCSNTAVFGERLSGTSLDKFQPTSDLPVIIGCGNSLPRKHRLYLSIIPSPPSEGTVHNCIMKAAIIGVKFYDASMDRSFKFFCGAHYGKLLDGRILIHDCWILYRVPKDISGLIQKIPIV